jgi:7-cyano-7-deazaguanine synthase
MSISPVEAQKKAGRIALGPLSGNPFPDARPSFFRAMEQALSLGLDHRIEIVTPFLDWEKEQVIQRGVELGVPLELTLSCMNPVVGPGGAGSASEDGALLLIFVCVRFSFRFEWTRRRF